MSNQRIILLDEQFDWLKDTLGKAIAVSFVCDLYGTETVATLINGHIVERDQSIPICPLSSCPIYFQMQVKGYEALQDIDDKRGPVPMKHMETGQVIWVDTENDAISSENAIPK